MWSAYEVIQPLPVDQSVRRLTTIPFMPPLIPKFNTAMNSPSLYIFPIVFKQFSLMSQWLCGICHTVTFHSFLTKHVSPLHNHTQASNMSLVASVYPFQWSESYRTQHLKVSPEMGSRHTVCNKGKAKTGYISEEKWIFQTTAITQF
jgi:hypothetical protein